MARPSAADRERPGRLISVRNERYEEAIEYIGSRAAVLSQAGASLSWTRERADTLFVCEASEEGSDDRAPASASGASNGRRSEGTRFSSPSDDEVGGFTARSAASGASNQTELLMDPVRLIDRRHAAYGAEDMVEVGWIRGLEGELGSADAVLTRGQAR